MTHTTPEQARKIARDLDDHNSSLDRASRIALRSLADTIDRLTAERDKCGSGAGCLYKDALIDSLTAERDAFKLDAGRYQWLRDHPTYMGWEHDFRADEIDRSVDADIDGEKSNG